MRRLVPTWKSGITAKIVAVCGSLLALYGCCYGFTAVTPSSTPRATATVQAVFRATERAVPDAPTATPQPTTTIVLTGTPERRVSPSTPRGALRPATPTPRPAPTQPALPERSQARVVQVIDGDTIEVGVDGRTYRVRYIGVDAPEPGAPNQLLGWMGRAASEANRAMVEGKTVYLEKDVSETDRYGRLLRYVFVGELFVNAELVRLGYAQVATYPPDVKYQSLFLSMQQEARNAGRGLWGTVPTTTPTAVVRTYSEPRTGNCDPSYPTVCIPPPPPDLDCADIPYRRFTVLPPDPHRFDGDHDGLGCER